MAPYLIDTQIDGTYNIVRLQETPEEFIEESIVIAGIIDVDTAISIVTNELNGYVHLHF